MDSRDDFRFRAYAAEKRVAELEGDIRVMAEKAAATHLPAYREQGRQMAELEAKLARLTGLIEKHNADCACPCKSSTSETAHFDWHGYDGDCPEDYKIALEGEQE